MSLETKTRNPVEYFGENVFDDRVMRERLPKETYRALKQCVGEGLPLTAKIAEVVANAMKDWAISKRGDPLHPLVPASQRVHRGEARILYLAHRQRRRYYGVLRQNADQRRVGRLQLPLRRIAGGV